LQGDAFFFYPGDTESNNAMQNERDKGHLALHTVAAEAKQKIWPPTAAAMQNGAGKKKTNRSPRQATATR
jgi:hypothetical protein